jgi:ABC-2 type transport system ATP-binding protein
VAEPILDARGVSKWYGDVIAVNDVTLEVAPGVTGLLGPNGAGKTTLFRLATGLLKPSAGEIRVLGEAPWDNVALLRRIGYVPDGAAPLPHETGVRAATLMARLSGLSGNEADASAREALRKVGLTSAADKRVGAYSRGMQQRLKFAFALLTAPELLLLDEPLTGTDPITRRELIALIKGIADAGAGVLLSTHVLPDVEALTQRIALMNHGRLVAHGEVGEIRDLLDRHPRTVRVGTSAPRDMGAALWTLPSVLSLETQEGAVIVKTKQPAVFFAELQDLLAKSPIPYSSIAPLDENVEAIFRYLVSEP